MDKLKRLLKGRRVSKKMFALIVGVVVWLLAQMNMSIDAAQVSKILVFIGGYIGVQGLQDAMVGMGSKREAIAQKVHKEVQSMAIKKLQKSSEHLGMKLKK